VRAGCTDAAFDLGALFAQGRGIQHGRETETSDCPRSFGQFLSRWRWSRSYKEAAELGDENAQHNLAYMYSDEGMDWLVIATVDQQEQLDPDFMHRFSHGFRVELNEDPDSGTNGLIGYPCDLDTDCR